MGQLALQNLSFSADGTQLLRGITFTQDNKGVNAILGPNGAGKSLLLSMMHGLIKPKSGTLSWDGKAPEKTKLSRGFVFQSPVVLRRSVRDNLAYPLKALKLDAKQRSKAITDMLHLSQLSDLADQPAASLSGGEAQRMAIARALIIQPETLLLDEPCSNLDPTSTKLIEAMILTFVENGGSVYISTHDMAQAKRIADVVLFIEAGKLLEHKSAMDFFSNASTPQAQTYLSGEL